MSERFERFVKMAQEEFGLTVVKSTNHENSTFEERRRKMTNREWMESLSDNDLAAFLTIGLFCECLWAPGP